MEALFSEFTLLSDQALCDKSFDPSTIEGLMRLFEVEAYKEWANLELECRNEAQSADDSVAEAEDYLDSVMESAMAEFHLFEEEMNQTCKAEHDSLVTTADAARRMGKTLEKAAAFASNKYIDAAVNSAAASMRSALRAVTAASKKVTSPYGNNLHHQENVTHCQSAFTTTEGGNCLACFWARGGFGGREGAADSSRLPIFPYSRWKTTMVIPFTVYPSFSAQAILPTPCCRWCSFHSTPIL